MTVEELKQKLSDFNDDRVVIVKDTFGGWDNIIDIKLESEGDAVCILFGGGSSFLSDNE